MPPQAGEAPVDLLGEIGSVIGEYPPLDDQPERATAVAAALLSGVQQPDAAPGVAAGLAEMVARLEPNRAVPLLLRIAELGRTPAADAARAALVRVNAGENNEHDPLKLIDAWRVEAPEADALAIDLGRGDGVEARAFLLRDRRADPGGVLVTGYAGAPTTDEELHEVLPELDEGGAPERLDADDVAEWILAGCATAVDGGEPIPAGLSVALTLLARPVLGAADALPLLEVDPTDAIYGEPDPSLVVDVEQNEDAAWDLIEALLADGLLGDWTVSDLSEFMLDWWPRKVTADPKTETHAPVAVLRFFRFLDDRDSLSGNSPEQLADAMDDLLEYFIDACMDRSSWGPGKSLLMKAAEAGVDINDRAALEAYLNQLAPRPGPATRRPQSARSARRARRRSARTARRRNRR